MSTTGARPPAIDAALIAVVCELLAANEEVRLSLPGWGRIHIDRRLPFLCVYRRPDDRPDPGTGELVTSEASYLLAPGKGELHDGLRDLTEEITRTLSGQFGAFLILELWSGQADEAEEPPAPGAPGPHFRIFVPGDQDPGSLVDALDEALLRIELRGQEAGVDVVCAERPATAPPPILPADVAGELGCHLLGLEVGPVYRDPRSGELYPVVLRDLRRALTRALRRTFYAFTHRYTSLRPDHFHVLGREAVVEAMWEADRRLAEVADRFDFLLQVTPFNPEEAWRYFLRARCQRPPVLHYRPLPVEPAILKRRLFETPLERVEDPALFHLLREKQEELDRKITLLTDINTPRFVHGSIQLFGGIEAELLELAEKVLSEVPLSEVPLSEMPPESGDGSGAGFCDAATFARRARQEIDIYRRAMPGLDAGVTIRDDTSSLMVSKGSVLIGQDLRVPLSEVEALLQHEVGTHVLTYYNGRAQRLRQLYSGLAGYTALQEGLAVLSEYLVSGLTRSRLRLLAARVVAAHRMLDGASFIETFREIDHTYGFGRQTAFRVTLRTYRGGGLTKDAVYLRGLVRLLDYLRRGGKLERLFIGKIALAHLPIIRELQWRRVLEPVPLTPRYMRRPETAAKLERLARGAGVLELL